MQQRERDIRRMVADLGMEITSFRTDGGSHWRVDVKTPNGRQRPFTFPTRDNGNWRTVKNEEAMLRRWRREVMPELDAAEEAGELEPPPPMRSQLADKLKQVGIPLRTEEPPRPGKLRLPAHLPPSHVSDVVLASTAVASGDASLVRDASAIPPREQRDEFKPGTPEQALASAVAIPKEQPMHTHTVTNTPPTEAVKRRNNYLNAKQQIQLADWMRKPGTLDEPTTQILFAEKATKALGFVVTESHVRTTLDSLGLELKRAQRADAGIGHRTRIRIIAESVVTLLEKSGLDVPLELLAIALGESEKPTSAKQ